MARGRKRVGWCLIPSFPLLKVHEYHIINTRTKSLKTRINLTLPFYHETQFVVKVGNVFKSCVSVCLFLGVAMRPLPMMPLVSNKSHGQASTV